MNAVLDVQDKRVMVVGLGASGVAACKLLAARGAKVVGNDAKARDAVAADVLALEDAGVQLVLGGEAGAQATGAREADLVVVSPGVPALPGIAAAEARGVPIWGEVELSVRAVLDASARDGRPSPRVVAVGGTNGKSTTTSLVGELLEAHGLRTFVGGNLGEPLALHTEEPWDAVVLEVSSFQMERVDAFRPDVSLLLNITPDHLDRYPDVDGYAAAKGNSFARQRGTDIAVVPFDDAVCEAQARRGEGTLVYFGAGADGALDVEVQEDAIVDHATGARFPRRAINLQGGHNALNVAAAIAAVRSFGVPAATIAEVLASFQGLAHRMALVAEHGGVRWYDDSKGTNVGASVTAVRGIVEPKVVLIAGGRDKGGSYGPLVEALREKGRAAVVIGEASDLIARAIGDVVPVARATTMEDAVERSRALAQRGDAVLLSPACSSFDMFKDYKQRGDAFVAAVKSLVAGKGA